MPNNMRQGPSDSQERVLFILNRVDDESGGTLSATINLAEALARTGVSVTISAPTRRGASLRAISRVDSAVSTRLFTATRPIHRIGASVLQALWLCVALRRFNAVHVHSTFYLSALYTSWLCRLLNVPFYVWPHSSLDPQDVQKHERLKRLTGRLVFGPMLSAARSLICTTSRESMTLETFGSHPRTAVIPLPVSPLPPSNGLDWRKRYGVDAGSFLVLFLGRIDRKKGLPLLIDAFAQMPGADQVLVVAGLGDPSVTAEARDRVAACDLESTVKFVGWLNSDERSAAFAASDVFVLPSAYENFGVAVVEAILSDVPVVISDQVYISDDLSSVGGAFVVPRSPAKIAATLSSIQSDRRQAAEKAERARRFAETTYSPDAVAAELRRLTIVSRQANAATAEPPAVHQ